MIDSETINKMGGLVYPFERSPNLRSYEPGEYIGFQEMLITPQDNEQFWESVSSHFVDDSEISSALPRKKRFLWIIDENNFKIILESTPNEQAPRKCVCHTNMTAGGKAVQGGELWITKDRHLYINNYSGRYGAIEEEQFLEAISFIRNLNIFANIIDYGINRRF